MDANLVRSAGFELTFHKSGALERFDHFPVSHGALSTSFRDNGDFLAILRRSGERGVDGAVARPWNARDHRLITPFDAMAGKLRGETFVCTVGLRHDQQSGRVLVDAVHNPGARNPANPRKPPCAVVKQCIDEGSIEVSCRRMHDKARGLVDDQQVIILEDNIERNFLRDVMSRRWCRYANGISCARLDLGCRVTRRSGIALRNQRLQSLSGKRGDQCRKRAIKPPTRHFRRDFNAFAGRLRFHGLAIGGMTVSISSELHAGLMAAAAGSPDVEICGLLFGVDGRIDRVEQMNNISSNLDSEFEIDPAQLIAAHRAARLGGPKVIGCFHSHPNGIATPSAKDAEAASGDSMLWLIIGGDQLTAWQSTDCGFVPVALAIDACASVAPSP